MHILFLVGCTYPVLIILGYNIPLFLTYYFNVYKFIMTSAFHHIRRDHYIGKGGRHRRVDHFTVLTQARHGWFTYTGFSGLIMSQGWHRLHGVSSWALTSLRYTRFHRA